MDQAGIELTTSRLRQLRQLPVVQHVRFTPLKSRQKTLLQWRARGSSISHCHWDSFLQYCLCVREFCFKYAYPMTVSGTEIRSALHFYSFDYKYLIVNACGFDMILTQDMAWCGHNKIMNSDIWIYVQLISFHNNAKYTVRDNLHLMSWRPADQTCRLFCIITLRPNDA